MGQPLSIGQVVHYRLSESDVTTINRKYPRTNVSGVHRNAVSEGDVYPAIVVRTFAEAPSNGNLQVFLDGDCTYWATSVGEGTSDEPGRWFWPPRV